MPLPWHGIVLDQGRRKGPTHRRERTRQAHCGVLGSHGRTRGSHASRRGKEYVYPAAQARERSIHAAHNQGRNRAAGTVRILKLWPALYFICLFLAHYIIVWRSYRLQAVPGNVASLLALSYALI